MTVFLLRAEGDRALADRIARGVERREQFVDEEDGLISGRPLGVKDRVVLIWSQAAAASPGRPGLERRALDAWSKERLVILLRDAATAPIGMRDLPLEAAPQSAQELEALLDRLCGPDAPPPSAARRTSPKPRRLGPALAVVAFVLSVLAGAGAVGGAMGWLPAAAFNFGLWASIVLLLVAVLVALRPRAGRPTAPPAQKSSTPGAPPPDEVRPPFALVSAAADDAIVEPLAAAVAARLDLEPLSDDRSPRELLARVQGARALIVICSPAAFAADHVKRITFLADLHGVPLLPIYVRAAAPTDDFAYYFAGAEGLLLYDTPEEDRAEAVVRAAETL